MLFAFKAAGAAADAMWLGVAVVIAIFATPLGTLIGAAPLVSALCESRGQVGLSGDGVLLARHMATALLVTIDGATSRDLDQAVQVEREGAGFLLRYALADAAYYVRPGTALFEEAVKRGASYYLPGFMIPMLPRALSEGIISLNPQVERRALVFEMHLDAAGKCQRTEVVRARVFSHAKLSFERAQAFYKGRENEPHVRDVWVAMGKAFTELQAWDQAVDAYRIAIGPPWELNPNNPVVHQEIVNVFETKGDKFAADTAAAELATRYAPGTKWFAANEKDREAMDNQRRIAERALYAATRNTHAAATQLRKDYEAAGKKDATAKQEYLAMYGKAVELYRTFITTYAESDYIYEFSFLEGEALYWSERYPEAVTQYKWVRDHRDLGTAYYIDAARSVVQSYEAEAQREVDAGKLAPLKIPSVADLKATPQPWQPQPIPELYLQLQSEYDAYQSFVADPKAAPQQGINAALISQAYFHIDDAIARFQKVMDKFCGSPEAAKSKDGILAIYEAQANFDAIEATNKRFIAAKCGDDKAIQLAISQNRSLNFSRADERYKKGDYRAAAEAFYKFYKTAPDNDPDLPVALFNAAVSYKLADKPKTAIALFKEFTEKKTKAFTDSPYFLKAMGLQAASYQAAFDYDNAVRTYLALYDTTKKAKRLGIKAPEPLPGEQPQTLEQIGLDAMYNAALAADNTE